MSIVSNLIQTANGPKGVDPGPINWSTVSQYASNQIGFDVDEDDPAFIKKKKKAKFDASAAPDVLEMHCVEGRLADVILQWAQGVEIDRKFEFDGVDASPLTWAALKGHMPVIKFLIDKGADVNNAGIKTGVTPLLWAATEGRHEAGKFLLMNGANPKHKGQHDCDAAFLAAQNSDLAFLHMLHKFSPVDPAAVDFEGHTLLHWGAYKGDLQVVEYCSEILGVSHNALDIHKRSALHWAAREGHTDVAVFLMKLGCSRTAVDDEGFSPLRWAEFRHHRETARALAQGVTEPIRRDTGTISFITSDKYALLHALCGVAFPVLMLLAYSWLPPILFLSAFPLYFSKNVVTSFLHHRPERAGAESVSLMQEIGAPRTLIAALRGIGPLRRREPMNLFGVCSFIGVQFMVFGAADLEVSTGCLIFLGLTVFFGSLAKMWSGRSVVPRGTLKESPVFAAVENEEFESLHGRVMDQERHIKLPLRAFYCIEWDCIIKKYDSWSLLLDCPVGESNHTTWFYYIISLFCLELHIFVSSWTHYSKELCHSAGAPLSMCRFLFSIFFHALPCPDVPKTNSWLDFFLPTKKNVAGIFLIVFAFMFLVALTSILIRQLTGIGKGLTRMELSNPEAACSNGGVSNVIRNGRSLYSEGSLFGNLIMFLIGKQGSKWKDRFTIPAPPTV